MDCSLAARRSLLLPHGPQLVRAALVIVACATVLLASGCRSLKLSSGDIKLVSEATGRGVTPEIVTAVYRYIDSSTADVYLSDLPLEVLMNPALTSRVKGSSPAIGAGNEGESLGQLGTLSGTIIHLHVFLVPRAGKTPIDATACNVTIRQVVLAGDAAGMYAGGGFVDVRALGGITLSGDIFGGTLRLAEASSTFADPLGPARITGAFTAQLDEQASLAAADVLAELGERLPSVRSETNRVRITQPSDGPASRPPGKSAGNAEPLK